MTFVARWLEVLHCLPHGEGAPRGVLMIVYPPAMLSSRVQASLASQTKNHIWTQARLGYNKEWSSHTFLLSMRVKTLLHTVPHSDDNYWYTLLLSHLFFFDEDIIYFFFCFTAFQTEGKLYLILEFLRGGDLFTRLSKEVFQCYNR